VTAICGGGTSSAQAGFGEAIYVTPAAIGAFLNNIPTAWAVPLAAYIGAMTFRLSTFCTTDPPAVPTITAADIVALLNPYNPIPYGDAQQKLQDLVGAFMWYQLCKCDSVSTPAAPTPPAAPTNIPTINPVLVGPSYPTSIPCYEADNSHHFTGSLTGTDFSIPMTGVTRIIGDITYQSRTHETIGTPTLYAIARDASNTALASCSMFMSSSTDRLHQDVSVPSGTTHVTFEWESSGGISSALDLSAHWQFFCGGAGPGVGVGPVPQPCPADPYTLGLLDQILALATIIQRQQVPFSYVLGTAHSGLSGAGHLSVSGLLGAKVVLDSTGSSVGFYSGDPAEIYSAGWITWGNADGSSKREFITHSPFVSLPALAGQYTRLGYTLGDGVSATITELVREP
jgi:hypothetical protein